MERLDSHGDGTIQLFFFMGQLLKLGIELSQQFYSGPKGRNPSDIRLAIDTLDPPPKSPVVLSHLGPPSYRLRLNP
jgi:hypothetical protein